MARADIDLAEVLADLKAIRNAVDRLETRLKSTEGEIIDPYKRRKEVLQRIYWADNSVSREDLLNLLQSCGTDYRWIGQQVKKGYLLVFPVPGGGTRYSVTSKAVLELGLTYIEEEVGEEGLSLVKLSESSFAEDWDSREDAIYDSL